MLVLAGRDNIADVEIERERENPNVTLSLIRFNRWPKLKNVYKILIVTKPSDPPHNLIHLLNNVNLFHFFLLNVLLLFMLFYMII